MTKKRDPKRPRDQRRPRQPPPTPAERARVEQILTQQRLDMVRGTHVTVSFEGVMDSRPANGIARVRPVGHTGWVAVVPADTVNLIPEEGSA